MRNRALAILLVLVMLLAVAPVSAGAASGAANAVKGNRARVAISNNRIVMKISWDKVAGAAGYEYAYNLFWKKGCKKSAYTIKTTGKTSATIRLKDYGTVDIRVRAYQKVKGKKLYGPWTTGRIKRSRVDDMVVKQLRNRMKSKSLFMKAKSGKAVVRSNAGDKYGALVKMGRGDEARATGKFKRAGNGVWWSEITYGLDQRNYVTGWVSRKYTDPVWY